MIQEIDRLVTAINNYNKRKSELMEQPSTVDAFADSKLLFYSEVIEKRLKEVAFVEPVKPQKKSKKKG